MFQSKVHETVCALLRAVLDDVIRPGDWVASEAQLAETLNVSRAVLREAFASLEPRGLLVTEHGHGTQVKAPFEDGHLDLLVDLLAVLDPERRQQLLESALSLRTLLWTQIARRTALRRNTICLDALLRCCEAMEASIALRSSAQELDHEEQRFRRLLLMVVDPMAMTLLMNSLESVIHAEFRDIIPNPPTGEERHQWMMDLTQAITDHRVEAAAKLMWTWIERENRMFLTAERPEPVPLHLRLRRPARPHVLAGFFD